MSRPTARTVLNMSDIAQAVLAVCRAARGAAPAMAALGRQTKDAALHQMADALLSSSSAILAANAEDVQRASATGMSQTLIDRLTVTPERLAGIANALGELAYLADPIGSVLRGSTLPNGIRLSQHRVPLGVVGIVYEARPNVTVDAAGICLKSGNVALLRGSASARSTNAALVDVLYRAGLLAGLPEHFLALVPGADHDSVQHLITARGLVDVVIPRGGAGLIQAVVLGATVPTIETGVGNCHVYVDASADLQMATDIVVNAKTRRPSVCNAAETLLVHASIADQALPMIANALWDKGVTVHAEPRALAILGDRALPAADDEFASEYLSMDIAVAVVDDLTAALAHIRAYGSGHTEAIVTGDLLAAQGFTEGVDAAAVMVNASTAFTDGGEFGFGAEIGISTQKLHARGPMGLAELTSTKWVLVGDGQIRGIS